jgi:predicted aminopeptidase
MPPWGDLRNEREREETTVKHCSCRHSLPDLQIYSTYLSVRRGKEGWEKEKVTAWNFFLPRSFLSPLQTCFPVSLCHQLKIINYFFLERIFSIFLF